MQGVDLMVRTARKAMLDELEAMLEVVDPQPPGKLGSMKRRKFDLPGGPVRKEIAMAVGQAFKSHQKRHQDLWSQNGMN